MCRRYGQRAFLRIDVLGLRVLTAPGPTLTAWIPVRHRRICDTAIYDRRIFCDFRRNDPVQARGRLGAKDSPRAAVVTPAVLVYAVPGKLPAFAIASGAEDPTLPSVRQRRIDDRERTAGGRDN